MAELAFEHLLAALEASGSLGTPIDPPTHRLNLAGTITPQRARYRPAEASGTLAEYTRSTTVRQWSTFEAEGGADPYILPLLLNALVKGGVDGSGGTAASYTTNLGGANRDLVFTALVTGVWGHGITITYVDAGADEALEVSVVGQAISVQLETDVGGDIQSTATDIMAAVNIHAAASLLVSAAIAPTQDGSGVVTAMAAANLAGGVDGAVTLPAGGVLSRLWDFTPTMTADDLLALTMYWGDPNVQEYQSSYCQIDTLTISGDGSGTDGVTLSMTGQGHFPSQVTPASVPAVVLAPLLVPGAMQLWIDSGASPIGTTEITGRVVSAETTIPSGVTRKFLPQGPGGNLQFVRIGRAKRHIQGRIVFEKPDTDQYDQWAAGTLVKVRVRFNGPAIETVGPTTFYYFVEVDLYGPWDALSYGELEGTNRTIELTLLTELEATAGVDFAVRVQNNRTTL